MGYVYYKIYINQFFIVHTENYKEKKNSALTGGLNAKNDLYQAILEWKEHTR